MLDRGILDELHQLPLLHGLSPDQLALFSQSLRQKTMPAGQELLSPGYQSAAVYFLLEGTVRITVPQMGGGGNILSICGPGAMLGEISALDGSAHFAGVTTIEECRLLWISQVNFSRHLNTMPVLGVNLSRMLALRLRSMAQRSHRMSRHSVPVRLAYVLLDIARHYPALITPGNDGERRPLPLALPQTDLAATIAATRVSVNKTLNEFSEKGWIEANKHQRITIRDHAALEEYCNSTGSTAT